MKLGLMIGSEHTSLRSGVELARSAEQAGFESLWMPEFWRSCSVPAAAVAEATTRIRLCTNVVMGFVRGPYISARVAADLGRASRKTRDQLSSLGFRCGRGVRIARDGLTPRAVC